MADNDKNIWEIIEEVLNGIPTSEEKQLFDSWINENGKNQNIFNTLKNIGLKKDPASGNEVKEKAYAQIQKTISREKATHKLKIWLYSAAASIALILAVKFAVFHFRPSFSPQVAYIETGASLGQKMKIVLSDSTVVFLNSGSKLKYPALFSGKQRMVFLEGEAYFEVSKDRKHPFVVNTGVINIQVFGTHFNVKAYHDEDLVETTLIEGSVGLTRKNDGKNRIMLKPNQKAVYSRKEKNISICKVDGELSTLWKDGKCYFDNETFESIIKNLERNFNVVIRINSESLKHKKYSGFFINKNVFQLLDAMKLHDNFNYKQNHDTIIINKN